jgi:hypothetical protein
MAKIMAQQGFLYEENVAKSLARKKWVKDGYNPAGASSDRPDLDIFINGKEYGCELKKDLASAGSLVIHHLGGMKYAYGETENEKEKEFLKGLGEKAGVMAAIKTKWRVEPFIQKERDNKWIARVKKTKLKLRERYQHDLRFCPDIYFSLPRHTISQYYNLKDTYYLNVATHGFYLLGKTDPAGLSRNKFGVESVPLWDDNHTAVLRIRIQSKGITEAEASEKAKGFPFAGGQGYQITMEIQFKSVGRSVYNIGPIIGKSASIDEARIKLP